jgi:hypothetical protein
LTLTDAAGLLGVGMIMIAYAGSALGKIDATKAPSLAVNLVGACLILLSLRYNFNVSAVAMEGSWAVVSLVGLIRLALRRKA